MVEPGSRSEGFLRLQSAGQALLVMSGEIKAGARPDRTRLERALEEAIAALLQLDPGCRGDLEQLLADVHAMPANDAAAHAVTEMARITKAANGPKTSRFAVN